jgi:uncharacterized membrane protein YbhN (UPF0104 family)
VIAERRIFWVRLLGSLITVALLIYLVNRLGWDEILAAILQIEAWRFVAVAGLMLVSRLAVSGRWYSLLQSARAGIPFSRSVEITFAGLFAANFLPTTVGGDVVRIAAAIQWGCDEAVSVASVIVDRIVGLLGMAIAVPFGIGPLLQYAPATSRTLGGEHAFAPRWGWMLLSTWTVSLPQKISKQMARLKEALLMWRGQPAALARALMATGLHMTCLFGAITLILGGLKDPLAFGRIAGLWSITYFVTLLPFSINGLGIQELSMVFIFSELGRISMDNSLTLSLLMRTLFVLASLPGALFLPTILAKRRNEGSPL